jgi:hypothetical protein
MSFKTVIAVTALTMTNLAMADNTALVTKAVRVQVPAAASGEITGKLTLLDGCLYVKFDRATNAGYRFARADQITSLQVLENGGWTGRSIKAVLKQEPQQCFAEANG